VVGINYLEWFPLTNLIEKDGTCHGKEIDLSCVLWNNTGAAYILENMTAISTKPSEVIQLATWGYAAG
jgi:hypothetical protein